VEHQAKRLSISQAKAFVNSAGMDGVGLHEFHSFETSAVIIREKGELWETPVDHANVGKASVDGELD
jgi:hypothetical protein